jgi:hypothetical protein
MMENEGATLAIQVGEAQAQIYREISLDECIEVVAQVDERIAASLRTTEKRLAAIHEEIITDPDMAVEYHMLQRAQSRVDDLLSRDLEAFSPEEQLRRVDQYHRYSTVGSTILWRDSGFSGGAKFFSVTWPNFKWWPYKFNDVASSAKAWGVNTIFEHTWYRGGRLWLIGLPYVEFRDLGVFGFNDIASSYVSVP